MTIPLPLRADREDRRRQCVDPRHGKRAITVRVNEVVGVAGFALPGNLVDVMVNTKDDADKPRFASLRARYSGGHVALLYVIVAFTDITASGFTNMPARRLPAARIAA